MRLSPISMTSLPPNEINTVPAEIEIDTKKTSGEILASYSEGGLVTKPN